MPERSSKKRLRDLNQLAAKIAEIATEGEKPAPDSGKNPAAVALGRLGGWVARRVEQQGRQN